MNQDKKFGECKAKILHAWAAFLAVCGKIWEYLKVKGKVILQILAACLLKLRDWQILATQWLRTACLKVKDWTVSWVMDVSDKLLHVYHRVSGWLDSRFGPLARRVKVRCADTFGPVYRPVKAWVDVKMEKYRRERAVRAEARAAAEAAAIEASEMEIVHKAPVKAPSPKLVDRVTNPYLRKTLVILTAVGAGLKIALKWIWRLRSVFLAVPVVWAAVKFAMLNMERLPEQVGLDIQASGEFARMISREQAVFWPLGLTLFCLLLTFCSKKPILPWVISIFTLVLPWLIWILNYYA